MTDQIRQNQPEGFGFSMCCARCGLSKQWFCTCPGERVMEGQLIASQRQMSFMDQTEPLWFERTQDMSGFVPPDTTLPLSDEQFQLQFNTADHENDIDVQLYEKPSLEEITIDSFDSIFHEDSDMFDNSNNYNLLATKIKAWLPKISNTEIDEFAKTSMIEDNGDFQVHITAENPPIISNTPKVEKKLPMIVKTPNYFSIFDSEEPVINDDLETLSCCAENNIIFELRDDMEVAEEVVVTTERDESNTSPLMFNSDPSENPVSKIKEDICSPTDLSSMETPCDIYAEFENDDSFLNIVTSLEKETHKLQLDMAAAMGTGSLLLANLPDTPDMLRTVFNPDPQFDFVRYMKDDNDPNNNDTTLSEPPQRPCTPKPSHSRGKSQLTIEELKESQIRVSDVSSEPVPGPSGTNSSKRPTRKSATNFRKRMQDGLLKLKPSQYEDDPSDDDEYVPKAKSRKTSTSSYSKKRLSSESDRSSICEDALKYRERRDRNNLSSKRSRQKRKEQQELMKVEQQKLEEENRRLKKRAEKLSRVLQSVNTFWKEHLKNISSRNE